MMGDKLKGVVIFITGMAAGSAVSWYFLKTKYEHISKEEIESVKEVYRKKYETHEEETAESSEEDEDEEYKPTSEEIEEHKEMVNNLGYTNYSNVKKGEAKNVDKPYVISPEEFDELPDYNTVSLLYYTDKVLADMNGNAIEDVDDIIGEDSLNHFGEYEDDSVFVRNDSRKTDYEILLDPRKYSDNFTTSCS